MTADLATLRIYNQNGKQIPLNALWKDCDAVLVFVRHFG